MVIGAYRNIWARSMRRTACYAAHNASGWVSGGRAGARGESDTYWNAGELHLEAEETFSSGRLALVCDRFTARKNMLEVDTVSPG